MDLGYLAFKDKFGEWLLHDKNNIYDLLTTDKILPLHEARHYREEIERYLAQLLISNEKVNKIVNNFYENEQACKEKYRIARSEPYKSILRHIIVIFNYYHRKFWDEQSNKFNVYEELVEMLNIMNEYIVDENSIIKENKYVSVIYRELKRHLNDRIPNDIKFGDIFDRHEFETENNKILQVIRENCEYIASLRVKEIMKDRFKKEIHVKVPESYSDLLRISKSLEELGFG